MNGHDRFFPQAEEYFQLRQPYQHHSAVPRQNLPIQALIADGSHAPVQFEPSGTLVNQFNLSGNLLTVKGDAASVSGANQVYYESNILTSKPSPSHAEVGSS